MYTSFETRLHNMWLKGHRSAIFILSNRLGFDIDYVNGYDDGEEKQTIHERNEQYAETERRFGK